MPKASYSAEALTEIQSHNPSLGQQQAQVTATNVRCAAEKEPNNYSLQL